MLESILIDMGNSPFCKVAATENGQIRWFRRIEKMELATTVKDLAQRHGKPRTICLSSVCTADPSLNAFLERSCNTFINLNGLLQGLPVTIGYSTPETLGADRIAAAVGANALFPGENCMIFDFGTAITVDFVNKDGLFKGGNISPGMNMRFEAIHQCTSNLPLVKPTLPFSLEGTETVSAINNGVILGIMFEVQKYIDIHPGYKIIFTGGDAIFFAKMLKCPIFVVCNLVFIGLAHIARLKDGC